MIKLSKRELDEIRTHERMLDETCARLGRIDMTIADLESQRDRVRVEAQRRAFELSAAGERAVSARGLGTGAGWRLDLKAGVIRPPHDDPSTKKRSR